MNDFTLTVLGANGYLGAEISRLGVALGLNVQGIARRGKAQWDEPWTHGVQWSAQSIQHTESLAERLMHSDAVVFAITRDAQHLELLDLALHTAQRAQLSKCVYLSHEPVAPWPDAMQAITQEAEARVAKHAGPWAILRSGLAWDDTQRPLAAAAAAHAMTPNQLKSAHPIRMERVAMAALRAAMQPQTTGVLSPEEVAHLGDAMMIQ